eukprot:gene20069-biopygen1011
MANSTPRCAAPAPLPRDSHRGSGRRAVRVVRHQRHGGAVAGGARHGVGGVRRGGRPGRPAVAVQLGFCLRTPRGLPSRPPGRRGADGYIALRPPLAPWRLMCAGELMGWGGAKGRGPPSAAASPHEAAPQRGWHVDVPSTRVAFRVVLANQKPCPEMLGVAAAAPAPKRRRA